MLIHGVQDRPQQALVVAQAPWTTLYKNMPDDRFVALLINIRYIYPQTQFEKAKYEWKLKTLPLSVVNITIEHM